jgi:MASE9 protein
MQSNASSTSKMFLALVVLSGLAVLANAVRHASSGDHVRFVSFLLVACLAARLKVKLPGLTGSMSVNLPFILVAVAEMSPVEAIAVGCLSTFVQCLPGATQKLSLVRLMFNFCNMALAIGATRLAFSQPSLGRVIVSHPVLLSLSAAVFFLVNTVPVAIIISLTEAKNVLKIWGNISQLSFPYFVASAAVAGLMLTASEQVGWQVPLFVLPVMFGIYHSYKRYFGTQTNASSVLLARTKAASAL